MTKSKKRAATAAEAVRAAIEKGLQARPDDLKSIEIVKIALSAYQSYVNHDLVAGNRGKPAAARSARPGCVESKHRRGFRRGTESAIDRTLFNVNYWVSAYEDRIVAACEDPEDAAVLLEKASTWTNHTMKLNRLSEVEAQHEFERFCPPICENNRRGNRDGGSGKGPVPDFVSCAQAIIERESEPVVSQPDGSARPSGDAGGDTSALARIVEDVQVEAGLYRSFQGGALKAFYDLLPAWCLQNRIDLVNGSWWEDADVVLAIADALRQGFRKNGFAITLCDYFYDSVNEALDGYEREVSPSFDEWASCSIPNLVSRIRDSRGEKTDQYDFEVDGYDDRMPAWLHSKEQLIWNIVVCALYGPGQARPFLPDMGFVDEDPVEKIDVITAIARSAYGSYVMQNSERGDIPIFTRFEDQPEDLRASMLAQVESFHDKLAVLGYHIVPSASCYPEQRIDALTKSEIDCLAILEHRRWLAEREAAGWTYSEKKDVSAKRSPYMVPWEDLPDRVREYNRTAVRIIPSLLLSVGLAVSR